MIEAKNDRPAEPDPATLPPLAGELPPRRVAAHLDAAFHHESAAFHHRQAARYLETGQDAAAERHIWAAFGHSLNAHEATRAGIAALRGGALRLASAAPEINGVRS